jgi:hypothetical protein
METDRLGLEWTHLDGFGQAQVQLLRLFQVYSDRVGYEKALNKWIRTDSRRKETRAKELGQHQIGKQLSKGSGQTLAGMSVFEIDLDRFS